MHTTQHYDVAIIGAGMSGLAAGIRLAHFGRKVCILERHNAVGGLNGFYSIAGRRYDVGLHAVTNYVRPGVKGTALTKLLRQLRITREELDLCEQKRSRISFGPHGETNLCFTNDFAFMEAEVAREFPAQIDGFRRFVQVIRAYDDTNLTPAPDMARAVMRGFISDPLLEDMLLCAVMYYGSAEEHDMRFAQFVIMFKALFLEGLARPYEGVRLILRILREKFQAAGGRRRMKCGVSRILARHGRAAALVLDNGDEITATHVFSSIGAAETQRLISEEASPPAEAWPVGRLSFVETINVLDRQPAALGWGDDAIVFFNASERFRYARPNEAVDADSGVICLPNNFDFGPGRELPEGIFRCTCLANHDQWVGCTEETYRAEKTRWFGRVQNSARRFLPGQADLTACTVASDMFTPRTIQHYTGHLGGAVYGSPRKNLTGRTTLENVYLCGTDQGYLGITGAMLSGITMANLHVLQSGK